MENMNTFLIPHTGENYRDIYILSSSSLWIFMCLHRFIGFSLKKKGLLIFWWSENLLECSDRPHIVPTCSTHQFYRLREFQGDRSTLPHKKVDFLILGEDISLILVIEIPSKLEGVPGFSDFPKNLQL